LRTEGAVSFGRETGERSYIVDGVENECGHNATKDQLVADTRKEGLLCWNRHGGHCIS
jgi:hypothetical protein